MIFLMMVLQGAQNRQKAEEFSAIVRSTLDRAGFLWHPAKSHWTPVERLTWLELCNSVSDLSAGQLEVPKEKILALKQQIHKALELTKIPARLLASTSWQNNIDGASDRFVYDSKYVPLF